MVSFRGRCCVWVQPWVRVGFTVRITVRVEILIGSQLALELE